MLKEISNMFFLILVTNFILIVGPRKTLAQIHVICNCNFLNFKVAAFVDQNKFEWQRFNIKITLFLALFYFDQRMRPHQIFTK
jgi:hypothetical protein